MAHKNSLLTKRREPKPTNSACAEFANQNTEFHWRFWHLKSRYFPKAPSQSPTDRRFHWRKNIPRRKPANRPQNSALPNSGVLAQGVCTKRGCFRCQNASPLTFHAFLKAKFPLLFQSRTTDRAVPLANQALQKQKRSLGCFNLKVFLRIYRSFLPQNTCL